MGFESLDIFKYKLYLILISTLLTFEILSVKNLKAIYLVI